MAKTIERSAREVSEIERHKYFLSEQAGHDVGWEHAVGDWDRKYADAFRQFQKGHPNGGKSISFLFRRLFK